MGGPGTIHPSVWLCSVPSIFRENHGSRARPRALTSSRSKGSAHPMWHRNWEIRPPSPRSQASGDKLCDSRLNHKGPCSQVTWCPQGHPFLRLAVWWERHFEVYTSFDLSSSGERDKKERMHSYIPSLRQLLAIFLHMLGIIPGCLLNYIEDSLSCRDL